MPHDESQRMIDDLNAELDTILYAISHDLRAPLRAIDGFSQAVVEDYGDKLDATGQDFLARVRNGGKAINTYIDGLLSLSRQSRGDIDPVLTNLSDISREAGAQAAASYPDHAPEFVVADDVELVVDRRLARFLMEKLLDNAWKFTQGTDGARIEVGGTKLDGQDVCYVRDNGAGFDMNYAEGRLFGPFQRMHADDEFPGTGVGLATAKRIVNRHGGRIWAESEPGKGTTVYFHTRNG